MTDIREIKFDTEELLNNINIIIQFGLNNLVKDFVEKHKLYEETHKGVLNLPSVKKLLAFNKEANVISDSDSDSENNDEGPTVFVSIKEMTENLVDEKIKFFEQTMVNSFQVFTSTNSFISQKLLSHIESLNNELKELKQAVQDIKPPVIDLTHDSEELEVQKVIERIVDEVVIKEEPIEEKENIVLQIVEEEEISEVEEESDSDDEVEEEKDSDDESEAESEAEAEAEAEADESEAEAEAEAEAEVVEEEVQVTLNQDIETEAEESESDEEENEEEENEEEENEEEENEEEENEEEEKQEDDDDNELFEIEIEDVTYCTNDEENGIIYELTEEGEAGKKVGFLKDGEATFY